MGKTLLVAAVAVLLSAGAALAQDDLTAAEQFRKRLRRYAPDVGLRPRVLCVCQDTSGNHGRVGEVRPEQVNQVRVTCAVPSFTGEGSLIGYSTCGTFVSLAR